MNARCANRRPRGIGCSRSSDQAESNKDADLSGKGSSMSIDTAPHVRLTVAVSAVDKASELAGTLASVHEAADEVIVLDTGLADEARQAARAAGARIVPHIWTSDFAAARNAALAAAKGEWVLFVDAGEELPADQIAALRALLVLDHNRQQAYLVYIQVPPATPQGAAQRIAQLRLIPNLPGMRFIGRVRETPAVSLAALGLTAQASNLTLHRGPAEHDPQRKRARALRDLHLLDLEMPEKGQQPRLLNALAECHATLANPHAARQYYSLALRHAAQGSTEMLEAYYGLLTSIDNPQHEQRIATCIEALEAFPFDAQLLCAMGNYLQVCGRADLAARSYESAVQFGQVNPETWHLADVAEVAALCLNTLWQTQGDDDQARSMLRDTLQRLPHSVRLRRSLIDLEVKYGRVLDALAQAERLPKDFPHREAFRTAIRGACQASRENWSAALGYLESAHDAGCREPLCWRWLAAALVASGRTDEAAEIARQWQDLEPASQEPRRLLQTTGVQGMIGDRQLRVDPAQAPATALGATGLVPAPANSMAARN
jgi:tetratricopeptide (TPR) repeat protein